MPRFGGGMYGANNGMIQDPMMMGNFAWLRSFNQMVGSIGQITELLGMNAEALNFCFGTWCKNCAMKNMLLLYLLLPEVSHEAI